MSVYERSRGWCFTIDNPKTQDHVDVCMLHETARYFIVSDEKGAKTRMPHYQGYVYFDNAHSRKTVSKMLPRASVRIARAAGEKAFRRAEYCQKKDEVTGLENPYYEYGEEPSPGLISKDNLIQVMENPEENYHVYNQYRRSYEFLLADKGKNQVKTRGIVPISYENRYFYMKSCVTPVYYYRGEKDTFNPKGQFKNYEHQKFMFLDWSNTGGFEIEDWANGVPETVRVGIVNICIDPDYLFLIYSDRKEWQEINTKYSSYIVEYDGEIRQEEF